MHLFRFTPLSICYVLTLCLQMQAQDAKWQVSAPTSVVIDTSLVGVSELSGITYVGSSMNALHYNFVAVQDNGGKLISINVQLSPTGQLLAATAISSLTLANSLDFEGVAYTNSARGSVFVAEEGAPGVREYDLTTGAQLQNVSRPNVFTNRRSNLGFESLARSPDGTTMWTANEEALTVDGPRATATAGTTVRLLKMDVDGNTVSAAEQYAYQVDPIHVSGFSSQRRSGLSDLVTLPDGTLLGLERSFDGVLPLSLSYQSRIYEIDTTTATDLSASSYDAGLIGQSYTPAEKELLWLGLATSAGGENLEGLTLGPRLANGNWLLVGVVDNSNGSDPVSFNTLVTFELAAIPSADFDEDGDVDGRDFLAWQRGYGKTIGAKHSEGDADRDGDVDAADLNVWSADYGTPLITAAQAVPEPATLSLMALSSLLVFWQRKPNHIVSLV